MLLEWENTERGKRGLGGTREREVERPLTKKRAITTTTTNPSGGTV